MKLTDMDRKPTLKQLNKVTESRFGFAIDYDAITMPKARAMSKKIMETVTKIRKSNAIHTAEQDPQYLQMLIMYEGLQRWMDAYRSQNQRKLVEGDLGQAEALLAAKDMVDTVQDMIEKIGKMQNEQLPALIDSIRDQIGTEQADQFKNSTGPILAGLITQLNQAREQLDTGARGLSGEQMPTAMSVGGAPGAVPPGGAPGGEMGGMDAMGAGGPSPEDGDGFGATDAAAGGPESLGRERR